MDRKACCVPFCRRTTGEAKHVAAAEWICAVHWRRVPRAVRRVKFRAERRRDWETAAMAWRACKRHAIGH